MIDELKIIAGRVREMREILELSPEAIAKKINVPAGTYLAYENASEDIPIGKLYLIADKFGVDPTLLLSGQSPKMADYTVVRAGRGISVERYAGYRFASLAYNFIGREMEPMIVSLQPGDDKPALVTHEGQEFNYVLSGVVNVTIGERVHTLNAGDSIYFNPAIPHGQSAVGVPSEFLTVINEGLQKQGSKKE